MLKEREKRKKKPSKSLMKNILLTRRRLTSEKKQEPQKRTRRPTLSNQKLKEIRLKERLQTLEVANSTTQQLQRVRTQDYSDSKLKKTISFSKKEEEEEAAEAQEAASEEAEAEVKTTPVLQVEEEAESHNKH